MASYMTVLHRLFIAKFHLQIACLASYFLTQDSEIWTPIMDKCKIHKDKGLDCLLPTHTQGRSWY